MSDRPMSTSELAVEAAAVIRMTKPQGSFKQGDVRELLSLDSVHNSIVRDFDNACEAAIRRCNDLRIVSERLERTMTLKAVKQP